MKKLSLKNATSMLSRKEMKALMGGYDAGIGKPEYFFDAKDC